MSTAAQQDEMLLIDFHLGRLDADAAQAVRRRLVADTEFSRRHHGLANTFAALNLVSADEIPAGLVNKTLARVATARRTDALLSMQRVAARRTLRPTFSLKELIAVAAGIIVMLGVLVPSLRLARQRSQRGMCAAQMGQIASAMQTYAISNGNFLPNCDARHTHWLRGGPIPPASNSAALFKLLRGRYVVSTTAFQCPAVAGGGFVLDDDMIDFPQPRHISYSYQYSLDGRGLSSRQPNLAKVVSQMAILADQTPVFTDGTFQKDRLDATVSDNHQAGQNVLYLDEHVDWTEKATVGVDEDNIFLVREVFDYKGDEKPAQPTDSFLLPAHAGK